jgi:uncharacterized membrane protein HdeD (DUF308 family)
MPLSIALAQILALFYVIVGLGMLFNTGYYRKMYEQAVKNPSMLLVSGMFALVAGIFLVLFHNFWVYSWEVIITVIGWAALIKGILLLLIPGQMMDMSKKWFKKKYLVASSGGVAVLLGVLLGYYGFFI